MKLRIALAVFLAAVIPVCAGIFSSSATFPTTVSFPVSAANNGTTDAAIISGAGEVSANGTWLDNGSFNGHRTYIKQGKSDQGDGSTWTLKYFSTTGWTLTADQNINIAGGGGADDLYKSSTIGDGTPDVAYPWLVSQWYVVSSVVALPVPTTLHGQAPGFPYTVDPEQPLPRYEGITNVQKLSLDPASPVGTQVSVSDSFYLSGTAQDDGFYYPDGGTVNGRASYTSPSAPNGGQISWDTAKWTNDNAINLGAGTNPWTTHVTATVTNPASQQLAAPGSAQGGVFVSGGTQDGVYRISGETTKERFNLVGYPPGDNWGIEWEFGIAFPSGAWNQWDADQVLIAYSEQDVATPDLVVQWKSGATEFVVSGVAGTYGPDNASPNGTYTNYLQGVFIFSDGINTTFTLDISGALPFHITWYNSDEDIGGTVASTANGLTWDNSAILTPSVIVPLTVTSVTSGQIAAGIKYGDDIYTVNGATNGRNKYSDVLGIATNFTWDGTKWTDGTHNGTGNTAFPWSVTGLTITQDDVAAEENWDEVP